MNTIKIDIPNIQPINIPKVPDFSNVKIDTTEIQSSVQAAQKIAKESKRNCLFAQLASYKVKTVPICGKINPLSEDDRSAVQKIIDQLVANNWLDEQTKNWCSENGITFK